LKITTQVSSATRACDQPSDNSWRIPDAALIGLVGLLTFFFSSAFALALMLLIPGIHRFAYTDFRQVYLSKLAALLCVVLICGPIVAALARKHKLGGFLTSIGWNQNKYTSWAALAGFTIGVLYHYGLVVLGLVYYHETSTPFNIGIAFVVMVVLHPLLEEFYFRGILYVALSDRLGTLKAVIITILLFVLCHPRHRLQVLPIAALLGFARLKTRSVACCLAMHVSYNLAMTFFAFYG
jgi:membrane protease YdiL (CAAX protease family)